MTTLGNRGIRILEMKLVTVRNNISIRPSYELKLKRMDIQFDPAPESALSRTSLSVIN